MQAHNPPFLRDLLSKQAPVPGTAAIVKQYKVLDPKTIFSTAFSMCHHSFGIGTMRRMPSRVGPIISKTPMRLHFRAVALNTIQHTWQEYFKYLKKHLLRLLQYL